MLDVDEEGCVGLMRVVFRVHHYGLESEEILVVGGLARLGEWNPARAVKLFKVRDGLYQVSFRAWPS